MNGKYGVILVVFGICIASVYPDEYLRANKVELTVFFSGLNVDSQEFFTNQLVPAYEQLGNYMSVNLVPYGTATTTQTGEDTYEVHCYDGGPKECFYNMIFACGNDMLRHNTEKQIMFDACVMNTNIRDLIMNNSECFIKAGIDFGTVDDCAQSDIGDRLLVEMGRLTPTISVVPTIYINGNCKPEDQCELRHDLTKYICDNLYNPPAVCRRRRRRRKEL